jgi:hypothetical protein
VVNASGGTGTAFIDDTAEDVRAREQRRMTVDDFNGVAEEGSPAQVELIDCP